MRLRRRLRLRHLVLAFALGAVAGIVTYRRSRLEASARQFRAEYG